MKALKASFLLAVLFAFLLSVCGVEAEGLTHVSYSETLTSEDGTVDIMFLIDQDVDYTVLPTYTVTPHYFSAEEVQQVAQLLFPEGTFYEARQTLNTDDSQAESQDSAEETTVPLEWAFQADELIDGNEKIAGEVASDSLHYMFSASTRQKDDYQISNIYAGLSYGDSTLELNNTEEPTDEQLAAVREQAEELISQLPVGQWEIAECTVKEITDYGTPEYQIHIRAVPVLDGNAVLAVPQYTTLRSTADYASTYYLSDLNIEYSPDGQLINFTLYSPVDIAETSSWNSLLSLDELMEKAAEYLAAESELHDEAASYEEMIVQSVEYGLVRIKGDSIDNYRYVPAVLLKGWYADYAEGSDVPTWQNEDANLLCLNAMDGSVIHLGQW